MVNFLWKEYNQVFKGQPEPEIQYQCPSRDWINKLRYKTDSKINWSSNLLSRWSMRPLLRAQSLEFTSDPDKEFCVVSDGTTTNKDQSTLMGIGLLDQVWLKSTKRINLFILFIDNELPFARIEVRHIQRCRIILPGNSWSLTKQCHPEYNIISWWHGSSSDQDSASPRHAFRYDYRESRSFTSIHVFIAHRWVKYLYLYYIFIQTLS